MHAKEARNRLAAAQYILKSDYAHNFSASNKSLKLFAQKKNNALFEGKNEIKNRRYTKSVDRTFVYEVYMEISSTCSINFTVNRGLRGKSNNYYRYRLKIVWHVSLYGFVDPEDPRLNGTLRIWTHMYIAHRDYISGRLKK